MERRGVEYQREMKRKGGGEKGSGTSETERIRISARDRLLIKRHDSVAENESRFKPFSLFPIPSPLHFYRDNVAKVLAKVFNGKVFLQLGIIPQVKVVPRAQRVPRSSLRGKILLRYRDKIVIEKFSFLLFPFFRKRREFIRKLATIFPPFNPDTIVAKEK